MTATTNSIYTLNNGAKGVEEDRLELQHRTIFLPTTKTLLPSLISKHLATLGRSPAVADVATGTGVWLKALAKELPSDSRLDGYDFDTTKFPTPEELPPNVKLTFGDGLKPFPGELLGQYDVVHVRLVMYGLKAHQWEEMAANLRKLLRPGGYLFWDETGFTSWNCLPMTDNFKKWISTEVRYAASVGRDVTSPMNLLEQIKNQGYANCSQVTFSTYSQNKQLQKDAGFAVLGAGRQSVHGIVAQGGFESLQTHDEADKLVQAVVDDIENAICVVGFDIVWTIGQNPVTG